LNRTIVILQCYQSSPFAMMMMGDGFSAPGLTPGLFGGDFSGTDVVLTKVLTPGTALALMALQFWSSCWSPSPFARAYLVLQGNVTSPKLGDVAVMSRTGSKNPTSGIKADSNSRC
jgi:hypothetical protein